MYVIFIIIFSHFAGCLRLTCVCVCMSMFVWIINVITITIECLSVSRHLLQTSFSVINDLCCYGLCLSVCVCVCALLCKVTNKVNQNRKWINIYKSVNTQFAYNTMGIPLYRTEESIRLKCGKKGESVEVWPHNDIFVQSFSWQWFSKVYNLSYLHFCHT